jgi:hypothetical protein
MDYLTSLNMRGNICVEGSFLYDNKPLFDLANNEKRYCHLFMEAHYICLLFAIDGASETDARC